MIVPTFVKAVTRKEKDALLEIARVFRSQSREQVRVAKGLTGDTMFLMMFEQDLFKEVSWQDLALGMKNGWLVKTKIRHTGGAHRWVYAYTGRTCLPRTRFARVVRRVKSWIGLNVEGPAR